MNVDNEIKQLTSYLPKKYTTPHSQQDTTSHDQQDALLDNQQKLKNEENSTIGHKNIPTYQKSHTVAENITVAESIMSTLVHSSAVSKSSPKTQLTEDIWDILTFMDTGGQPQYISMLPAVNSFAMITFIVHKMTGGRKSLDDKFMVQHGNKKGEHSFTPYEHECTYLQLIKTLMSYASVNFFPDNSFLKGKKIFNDQTQCRSISFVGTHSKNVSDDDIMEIDKVLIDIIENSSSENIKIKLNEVYKYLVPIDNKEQNKSLSERNEINKSADNEEHDAKKYTNPSKIRNYIYEWMKKQDIYAIPIQWLLLELEIRKECESKQCSFITCEQVLKIGREKHLGDANFIKTGIRFHHLFGVLLYFEKVEGMQELVITNHQWLFKKLSEIVKYSFKPDIKIHEDDLSKGIFNESMLNKLHIDKDFEKSGINTKLFNPKMAFLKLLQHLLIIACLNENSTKYFMPSLLKSSNDVDQQKNVPGISNFMHLIKDSQSLLIQFESTDLTNSFPRGFLCFLVVQLIHSTKWELYKKNTYNNTLTFFKVNDGYYVTLVDKIFFLEIIVTHDDTDKPPIHHKVFQTIERAIFEVGKKLNIVIKLKYGFVCKMCGDSEETHMTYLSYNKIYECYCAGQNRTELEESHKVWLLEVHIILMDYVYNYSYNYVRILVGT